MKLLIYIGSIAMMLFSCNAAASSQEEAEVVDYDESDVDTSFINESNEITNATVESPKPLFESLDTSFTHNILLVPEGFEVNILFQEKEDMVVTASGASAPAKGNHDMIAIIPGMDKNHASLFVSHETKYHDAVLGDGGGATMFDIKRENAKWKVVSDYNHVDFSTVGNTDRNCGGVIGPNGMVYTCEEYMTNSNDRLYRKGKGHLNLDSVGDLAYWENIGYVVEVDPKTMKATQKMIGMGRYFHEDLEFMDDNKTVFLTDDYEPAVFYKFVADNPLDYSKGTLYAFKQDENGTVGSWIEMDRDTNTMIHARDIAVSKGATMFMRHEWLCRDGNKLYIGETGHDKATWKNRLDQGGKVANALKAYDDGTNIVDKYGRILVFDASTNEMKTYLEGGVSEDGATVFSNPDCVSLAKIGGKKYLLIHEDINKNSLGRVPKHVEDKNHYYNELYFLDLSIESPTVEDLRRFAIGPQGAELTGGVMSKDGSTLFVNVQHPNYYNGSPYHRSCTVAITGFNK